MTGWTPPVPKPTDRAHVARAIERLNAARAELVVARQLLLGATGSFDTEKVVWRELDPLVAQVVDLAGSLHGWSE